MSEAPAEAGDVDEDAGSPIPDPPRRVPFGVAVTVALLGFIAVFLLLIATLIIVATTNRPDAMGRTLAEGLSAAAILAAAALVTALAWSFVRDGRTVGPMIVGCVVLLLGLVALGNGVIGDSPEAGLLRLSMVALPVGLGLLLVPLAGHGPAYLAARRVWSRAERDWLHEMATPVAAVHYPQQQWPGHHPPQQWGGYPPQHQYPPQPAQAWAGQQPGQVWAGPQPGQAWAAQQPPQHQGWPDPAAPVWVDPQAAAQQFSAPPAQGPPAQGPPAQGPPTQGPPFPAQPFPAPAGQAMPFPAQPAPEQPQQPVQAVHPQPGPGESPPAPPAAQQAPTEQIRTADPVPPDAPRQ